MSDDEWLSRNTDGPDNPYSKVYGAAETTRLLGAFCINRSEIHFFDHRHWGVVGRMLPGRLIGALGRRWGWHRIVCAQKALIGAGPGAVIGGLGAVAIALLWIKLFPDFWRVQSVIPEK